MQLDQAACCNYYNALMSNRPLHNSGSQAEPTAKRKLKRWIASIFLLPLLLLTVLALAIAYRIHAENSEAGHDHLPQFQRPQRVSSILIFSPHPDDETLGAAKIRLPDSAPDIVRGGWADGAVDLDDGHGFALSGQRAKRNQQDRQKHGETFHDTERLPHREAGVSFHECD